MNEIEKAIEILNDTEADCDYSKNEICCASLLAISALEKQIPVKGNFEGYMDEHYGEGCKCTICGKCFVGKQNYCCGCGQKLDWGKLLR